MAISLFKSGTHFNLSAHVGLESVLGFAEAWVVLQEENQMLHIEIFYFDVSSV